MEELEKPTVETDDNQDIWATMSFSSKKTKAVKLEKSTTK